MHNVLYKMRYVSFLLVHIHGNSAKPNTTTILSKLLLYSIYLTTTITFTRHTGNDRDTKHTVCLTGSPTVKQTLKNVRIVNTGRDSKQVYVWLSAVQTPKQFSYQTKQLCVDSFFPPLECHHFTLDLKEVKLTRTKKKKSTMLTERPQASQKLRSHLLNLRFLDETCPWTQC